MAVACTSGSFSSSRFGAFLNRCTRFLYCFGARWFGFFTRCATILPQSWLGINEHSAGRCDLSRYTWQKCAKPTLVALDPFVSGVAGIDITREIDPISFTTEAFVVGVALVLGCYRPFWRRWLYLENSLAYHGSSSGFKDGGTFHGIDSGSFLKRCSWRCVTSQIVKSWLWIRTLIWSYTVTDRTVNLFEERSFYDILFVNHLASQRFSHQRCRICFWQHCWGLSEVRQSRIDSYDDNIDYIDLEMIVYSFKASDQHSFLCYWRIPR